jgi:hypothetical protein
MFIAEDHVYTTKVADKHTICLMVSRHCILLTIAILEDLQTRFGTFVVFTFHAEALV